MDLILVTGSCGRIGSALVKRLEGNDLVIGLDIVRHCPSFKQSHLVPVDFGSDESVREALGYVQKNFGKRIASVIHLAAYYSFSEKHSPLYEEITVKGTKRLLEQLQVFEVQQFLFTSTMLVHAPTRPGGPITEQSPIAPSWDYPMSKAKTEELIREMRGNIPVVFFRIAGVYDNECHSIPISHQIQRIYEKKLEASLFSGNIHHGASFVHMDDVVEAIALAIEKRRELPKEISFLIGEGRTYSYDQLQRQISRLLFHREIKTFRVPKWFAKLGAWIQALFAFREKPFIRPWMVELADEHYELDITQAKRLLGWTPKHSLEKALPLMIESLKKDPKKWYKANQLNKLFNQRESF